MGDRTTASRGNDRTVSQPGTSQPASFDPYEYWGDTGRRDGAQPGAGQQGGPVPPARPADAAAQTHTVRKGESLWSIADNMVRRSSETDKSDKVVLNVVLGIIEKNKGTFRGLEANPDLILPRQTLQIASVRELAQLGQGKTLNTHYKPDEHRARETSNDEQTDRSRRRRPEAQGDRARPEGDYVRTPGYEGPERRRPTEHQRRAHHPAEDARDYGAYPVDTVPRGRAHAQQRYEQPHSAADMGAVRDIFGMFAGLARGAMRDRFDDRHTNHGYRHHPYLMGQPRGYFDDRQDQNFFTRHQPWGQQRSYWEQQQRWDNGRHGANYNPRHHRQDFMDPYELQQQREWRRQQRMRY